jgi:hypothetical protein
MSVGYTQTSSVPFDINVMTGLAATGAVIKLFFAQPTTDTGITGPASAAIWGYGTMAMSLLGVMVVTFALSSKDSMRSGIWEFLKGVASTSLPTMLLLGILIWIISMNTAFFKRINQGRVAPEYAGFSTLSTVMIILQLCVLLKFLKDKTDATSQAKEGHSILSKMWLAITAEMRTLTYVLTTVNLIVAGIMQVILAFFSTDG